MILVIQIIVVVFMYTCFNLVFAIECIIVFIIILPSVVTTGEPVAVVVTSDVTVGVVCSVLVEGEKVVVVFASVVAVFVSVVGDREAVASVVISDIIVVVLASVDEVYGVRVVAFVVDDGGKFVDVVASVVMVGTKVVAFVS